MILNIVNQTPLKILSPKRNVFAAPHADSAVRPGENVQTFPSNRLSTLQIICLFRTHLFRTLSLAASFLGRELLLKASRSQKEVSVPWIARTNHNRLTTDRRPLRVSGYSGQLALQAAARVVTSEKWAISIAQNATGLISTKAVARLFEYLY